MKEKKYTIILWRETSRPDDALQGHKCVRFHDACTISEARQLFRDTIVSCTRLDLLHRGDVMQIVTIKKGKVNQEIKFQ